MDTKFRMWVAQLSFLTGVLLAAWIAKAASADDPIRMRVETLTVPPSTRPLVFVVVQNAGQDTWEGEISLKGPESWQLAPAQRTVKIPAGQSERVAFSVEDARNVAANRYPFTISARSGDQLFVHSQETFVASAPYFKVEVDGRAEEWKDAIPIAFTAGERLTTVSTYWSRRQFCVLIAVQETKLVPLEKEGDEPFDAVQFALAPADSENPSARQELAGRFEFLVAGTRDGGARCFQLASPETRLEETSKARFLESLAYEDAEVAVHRQDDVTCYECSLPFRPMSEQIRPSEGREFFFSVLVHDPDGTGVRDLGRAAGLWKTPEDRSDWSQWPGSRWGNDAPLGNKIRWGLCTSKY